MTGGQSGKFPTGSSSDAVLPKSSGGLIRRRAAERNILMVPMANKYMAISKIENI